MPVLPIHRIRHGGLGVLAVAVLAATPMPASSAEEVVDLELVLAVDTSWSMDYDEQVLQRAGYVQAFRHPDVIAAIQGGDWGRIAVTYVEWGGSDLQAVRVPWMMIDGAEAGEAFADRLGEMPIGRMRRTSISGALDFSAALFDGNGFEGMRRAVDISGDGPNNMGRKVTDARDALLARGVTINGLPIMIKRSNPGGYFNLENLDIYYEDCVIGGFGAFSISIDSPEQFAEAIRRKLILEIASAAARVVPAQLAGAEPRIDCLIGEKQWRIWQGDRF